MGEDRFITTPDGRKIRAMIHGNGPTLVVLDAGLGANGFYWSKTYKLLAEKLPNVCIVAYDRAGMGASDPDPRPRTLAHMADDLDTIIDSFVPRQVFLIGHSWGGTLAQFAAARRRAAGRTITASCLSTPAPGPTSTAASKYGPALPSPHPSCGYSAAPGWPN